MSKDNKGGGGDDWSPGNTPPVTDHFKYTSGPPEPPETRPPSKMEYEERCEMVGEIQSRIKKEADGSIAKEFLEQKQKDNNDRIRYIAERLREARREQVTENFNKRSR